MKLTAHVAATALLLTGLLGANAQARTNTTASFTPQGDILVVVDGKAGVANLQGQWLVEPAYRQLRSLKDGSFAGLNPEGIEFISAQGHKSRPDALNERFQQLKSATPRVGYLGDVSPDGKVAIIWGRTTEPLQYETGVVDVASGQWLVEPGRCGQITFAKPAADALVLSCTEGAEVRDLQGKLLYSLGKGKYPQLKQVGSAAFLVGSTTSLDGAQLYVNGRETSQKYRNVVSLGGAYFQGAGEGGNSSAVYKVTADGAVRLRDRASYERQFASEGLLFECTEDTAALTKQLEAKMPGARGDLATATVDMGFCHFKDEKGALRTSRAYAISAPFVKNQTLACVWEVERVTCDVLRSDGKVAAKGLEVPEIVRSISVAPDGKTFLLNSRWLLRQDGGLAELSISGKGIELKRVR